VFQRSRVNDREWIDRITTQFLAEDLHSRSIDMATRKTYDQQPGSVPEIRSEGDSVLFHFDVVGLRQESRLIVRCSPDGTVTAAILSGKSSRARRKE
jgi:hypothetical protein